MEKNESKKSIFTHLLFLVMGFIFGAVIIGAIERNEFKEDTLHMWRDRAKMKELVDVIEAKDEFKDRDEWIQHIESKASEIATRFERQKGHIQSELSIPLAPASLTP